MSLLHNFFTCKFQNHSLSLKNRFTGSWKANHWKGHLASPCGKLLRVCVCIQDKQDKRCLFFCRSKSLWDASFYCIIIEGLTWKDNQLLLGIVKLSSLLNLLVDSKQDKRCLFSCSLQIQDVVRCFFLLHSYKAFILSRFWALQNWVEGVEFIESAKVK